MSAPNPCICFISTHNITTLREGISVVLLIDLHVLLYLSVCSLGKILTEHLFHVPHHIGCSSGFKRWISPLGPYFGHSVPTAWTLATLPFLSTHPSDGAWFQYYFLNPPLHLRSTVHAVAVLCAFIPRTYPGLYDLTLSSMKAGVGRSSLKASYVIIVSPVWTIEVN